MNGDKQAALGELIRRGMPTLPYLEFLNGLMESSQTQGSALSAQSSSSYFYDPFVVDMRNSPDEEEQSYIERQDIHKNLLGSRVIIGRSGIGKTRLQRKLLRQDLDHPSSTFTVALPMESLAQEGDIQGGRMPSLSMKIIIQTIFEEYWNRYILASYLREKYPAPFQSRTWLLRLHWFFKHFPPAWQEFPPDPRLTDWLRSDLAAQPIRENLSSEQALDQLIKLITESEIIQMDERNEPKNVPIKRIELLIDGVEQLSEFAVSRLICDVQRLYELRLSFKLFLEPIHEKQLENLECYRQGRVSLLRLPDWTENELVEMLNRRWWAFKHAEFEPNLEPDLSPFHQPQLNRRFFRHIVKQVLAYLGEGSQHEELAAPVHVLNLARGCLAACKEKYFEPYGINGKLTLADIDTIFKAYWAA